MWRSTVSLSCLFVIQWSASCPATLRKSLNGLHIENRTKEWTRFERHLGGRKTLDASRWLSVSHCHSPKTTPAIRWQLLRSWQKMMRNPCQSWWRLTRFCTKSSVLAMIMVYHFWPHRDHFASYHLYLDHGFPRHWASFWSTCSPCSVQYDVIGKLESPEDFRVN